MAKRKTFCAFCRKTILFKPMYASSSIQAACTQALANAWLLAASPAGVYPTALGCVLRCAIRAKPARLWHRATPLLCSRVALAGAYTGEPSASVLGRFLSSGARRKPAGTLGRPDAEIMRGQERIKNCSTVSADPLIGCHPKQLAGAANITLVTLLICNLLSKM